MTVNRELEQQVRSLCEWYGDGADGSAPTATQWRRILERPADSPLTLINFFKLRDAARYATGPDQGGPATGQEAFGRYAAVSMPAMARAGGRFLHVGPYAGTFLGEGTLPPEADDWDLVAIGSYPDRAALLALYCDPDYRAAFPHRTAACARQKVFVCTQQP